MINFKAEDKQSKPSLPDDSYSKMHIIDGHTHDLVTGSGKSDNPLQVLSSVEYFDDILDEDLKNIGQLKEIGITSIILTDGPVECFRSIANVLIEKGYPLEHVKKIMGGNLIDFFSAAEANPN